MTGKINDLKAALEHAKKLLAENDSRDKDGDIRDLTIELEDAHLMITKQQRQMEEAKASLAVQS